MSTHFKRETNPRGVGARAVRVRRITGEEELRQADHIVNGDAGALGERVAARTSGERTSPLPSMNPHVDRSLFEHNAHGHGIRWPTWLG